jgi:hypothetical protein
MVQRKPREAGQKMRRGSIKRGQSGKFRLEYSLAFQNPATGRNR